MLGVPEWKRTDRGERTTLCVWQKSQAYCSESNRKSESSPHPWPCACLWSSWTQPNGLIRHLTGRQTWVPSSNLTFRNQDLRNTCACSEEIIIWNRFGTCRVGGQLVWDARCSETGLVVWMTFISAGSASFFCSHRFLSYPFWSECRILALSASLEWEILMLFDSWAYSGAFWEWVWWLYISSFCSWKRGVLYRVT